jgi:hypothetical protein
MDDEKHHHHHRNSRRHDRQADATSARFNSLGGSQAAVGTVFTWYCTWLMIDGGSELENSLRHARPKADVGSFSKLTWLSSFFENLSIMMW